MILSHAGSLVYTVYFKFHLYMNKKSENKMFHHIVMLEFKKTLTQTEHSQIEKFCRDIKSELTDVINMRFVKNISNRANGYTHAFVVEFVDENAHDNYQVAEVHVLLKKMINELALNTVVLDYEL
mgnify:CR=1 FL=1